MIGARYATHLCHFVHWIDPKSALYGGGVKRNDCTIRRVKIESQGEYGISSAREKITIVGIDCHAIVAPAAGGTNPHTTR